jgi:aminopeptidase N
MQVVINTSYSNFAISPDAISLIRKKIKNSKAKSQINAYAFDNDRSHPLLVEAVQKLGAKANGLYTTLKIVEIPDDVEWRVDAINGKEVIREKHRMWS